MTIDVRKQTMRPDWENMEKPSWQRAVKKWLNFQSGEEEFHTDCDRKNSTDEDLYEVPSKHLSSSSSPSSVYSKDALNIDDSLNLRMLVGTWNVGGKSAKAEEEFNLKDCFTTSPAFADIYVLGFQEMVPLNAGNVLGLEGKGEAERWIALISQSLNNNCNDDDESFELVGSKQMVGIFLCVWARSSLCPLISNLSISCVATGAMGLLGNKGSVSISMTLCRVTFCFVCTHLASGHKQGDELKRNSDVAQILSSTRFDRRAPQTILDHDNVIWLGDLNYRLATDDSTYELLNKQDWQTLLLKDQLRIEQKCGRVFQGWEEGKINFAPTYKYLDNSDIYYYVSQSFKARHKQRIPAWCDRILWKGEGIRQEWYVRGESKFSDHRPVYSLFQLSPNNQNQNPKRHLNYSHSHQQQHKPNAVVPSSFAKVQAEELLPVITTPKLSCEQ